MSSRLLLLCPLVILGCGPSAPPRQVTPLTDPAKPVVFGDVAQKKGFRLVWPAEPKATLAEYDDPPLFQWILKAEITTPINSTSVTFNMYAEERVKPTQELEERKRLLEASIEQDNYLGLGIATIERTNFPFGKGQHLAADATLTWSQDRCRVLTVITERHTYRLSCWTKKRELLTSDPVERFLKSFELIE